MSTLSFGFGRRDITPRIGVELAGYGPFRHRYSTSIRDRLECRALALRLDNKYVLLISCDLPTLSLDISTQVRQQLSKQHRIPSADIIIQAIHTHSGPSLRNVWSGWGEPDAPYLELLPHRILSAANHALADLQRGEIKYAKAPCRGIAINREYDDFSAEDVDMVADDNWQPAKPELTDDHCHVISFYRDDKLHGIISSYGCHPVVAGPESTSIHGDWAGISSHVLEEHFPGACAMFLQGAQGDINAAITCAHGDRAERALNILSQRYAQSVINGVIAGEPLDVQQLSAIQKFIPFSRKAFTREQLQNECDELEAFFASDKTKEAENDTRMNMVKLNAVRYFLNAIDTNINLNPAIEIQGIGIGPLRLLAAPFEIHRQIKLDTIEQSSDQQQAPIILGLCNHSYGYAVDKTIAARGGYAADLVPYISRELPFAHIHEELLNIFSLIDYELVGAGHHAQKALKI